MRKVKPNRGPLKGAAFERHLCVRFSLWVSHGKRKDLFWRTAMSGGRATLALKQGEAHRESGDMGSRDPAGYVLTDYFFFEFKHHNDIQFEAFVLKNKGKLAKWWAKTCKQAKQHGRDPVLIAKGNFMPTLIITARPFENPNVDVEKVAVLNPKPVCLLLVEPQDCYIGLLDRTFMEPF